MCRMQFLLLFVALYVGMVHSWEIATSTEDGSLSFYTEESLTSTYSIPSRKLYALTYDEVHNMMLYVDRQTNDHCVCGFYLTSLENKCFTTAKGRNIHDLAFDLVSERVFFTDTNDRSINWISLKSGSNYNVNLLIKVLDGIPHDIVVDSCEGHIYWLNKNMTKPTIERAQLNGTKREVFETLNATSVNNTFKLEPSSLAIDPPARWIYWLEPDSHNSYTLVSSTLNRKGRHNCIAKINQQTVPTTTNSLVVLKNAVLRMLFGRSYIRSYLKTFKTSDIKHTYKSSDKKLLVSMAANYETDDLIQVCKALSQVEISTEYDGPYCVHGKKVNGKSTCRCTPGYTGERCDVSVCNNYCLQGNCSFNDKGLPKCRCNAGSTGERCEVDVNVNMSILVNHRGKPYTYSFPENCEKL